MLCQPKAPIFLLYIIIASADNAAHQQYLYIKMKHPMLSLHRECYRTL